MTDDDDQVIEGVAAPQPFMAAGNRQANRPIISAIPRVVADKAAVMRFNLPADAGFLLSLVDGQTTIQEIVSIAGMDAFDAFRILKNLLEVNITAVEP